MSDDIVEGLERACRYLDGFSTPEAHAAWEAVSEGAAEIERLRADALATTSALAGVGTVLTEEGALREIDFLPSIRTAWHVSLGGKTWAEAWEVTDE